jgi:hypothetical protein
MRISSNGPLRGAQKVHAQEGIAVTLAQMAVNGRPWAMARERFPVDLRCVACTGQ